MNPENPVVQPPQTIQPKQLPHPLVVTVPLVLVVISLIASILVFAISVYLAITTFNKEYDNQTASIIHIPLKTNKFKNVSIEAQAAFVYEVKTGRIMYQKNADTPLPLASITKVMTALLVSENIPEGNIITITPEDLSIEGDNGLKENQPWKLEDLLNFTLLESSNDGAHALASFTSTYKKNNFIEEMNKKAESLNLKTMHFKNATGLDLGDGTAGAYGSAKDVAGLFNYIITEKSNLLEATKLNSYRLKALDDTLYQAKNTNVIACKIPGLMASKTGYTELAGGNLAVVFDAGLNNPIIIVVLGSSEQGRFGDVFTLAKLAQQSL